MLLSFPFVSNRAFSVGVQSVQYAKRAAPVYLPPPQLFLPHRNRPVS